MPTAAASRLIRKADKPFSLNVITDSLLNVTKAPKPGALPEAEAILSIFNFKLNDNNSYLH
ncbi:hypothetical protein MBHK15_80295 [Marinobacter salarius]|nr:hypothetical protein MBHK15_80295 [Marinobacter salarius]